MNINFKIKKLVKAIKQKITKKKKKNKKEDPFIYPHY